MIEIERKFLVTNYIFKEYAHNYNHIKQGFLSTDPKRTVRVRLRDNEGFLTIKGESSANGMSRFEWENPIPKADALQLLKLCKGVYIEKIRYNIKVDHHTFEVDEFLGANLGLIIAEVELDKEDDYFKKPEWLGKEVTGDIKYYNSYMSTHPFSKWEK